MFEDPCNVRESLVKRYDKDWSLIHWFFNLRQGRRLSGQTFDLIKSQSFQMSVGPSLDGFLAQFVQVVEEEISCALYPQEPIG